MGRWKVKVQLYGQILLLLSVLAISSVSLAAERYVRAGATGANNGTDWTNAFTTLPAMLVRGDTYYVADGSYAGYTFDDAVTGTVLITIKKATIADHGTDIGWLDSFGDGQAVFGPLWFTTSYWTFDGQTRNEANWRDTASYGLKINNTSGASAGIRIGDFGVDATNITVQYVDVEGSHSFNDVVNDSGLRILGTFSNNLLISRCAIHHTGSVNILWRGADNSIVERCWMAYDDSSAASHAEGVSISENVNGWTFRYNVMEDIEGSGFIATAGVNTTGPGASSNWYIYGNLFMRSAANPESRSLVSPGTIAVFGFEHHGDFFVLNNTFVRINLFSNDFSHVSVTGSVVDLVTIRNNLWWNCTGFTVPVGPGWAVSHNAYYNTPVTDSDPNKQVGTGNPFVDSSDATKNFRLTAATNAGFSLLAPFNTDPDGTTRGNGVWDRGAYEFGGNTAQPNPPTNLRAF